MRKNPVDFIRYELSPSNSAENIRHPSRTTVAKICCGNELSIPGDVVGFQGKVSGDHKIYHALSAFGDIVSKSHHRYRLVKIKGSLKFIDINET